MLLSYVVNSSPIISHHHSAFAPESAVDWEPLFEKNGVVAKRRPGAVVCTRGESFLPFSLTEIFEVLVNNPRMGEFNKQLDFAKLLQIWNNTTGVQRMKFKQVRRVRSLPWLYFK